MSGIACECAGQQSMRESITILELNSNVFALQALCSSCCNMKFLLPYMDNKEGRVCQVCCNALLRGK